MTTKPLVLITGGSRGIGRATAVRFLRAGWTVAINYRNGVADAAEVVGLDPANCRAYRADVSVEDDVTQMVAQITAELGPVHALVNNAAIWRGGAVDRLSSAAFIEVLTVSLLGAKNCTAAVLPSMRRLNDGHVVNVSSAVAEVGWSGDTAYAAAKAGLIGFTRSLAKELARFGIRVNAIAPGFIRTDMTMDVPAEQRQQLVERTLLRRAGEPEDVADVIYALVDSGRYMTGSVISVDGGLVLGNDRRRDFGAGMRAANVDAVPDVATDFEL
jgi:3-oxoacyl-[acyl-carrier protein] reductase